ncbi:energy-coupling factor transporter ATP-binding protein EcfA2 [Arthrobacter pascens]|uniref:AAA family ATPase n=1 Tax=Arthrobacter pascens TaxID=1677 RepID=UPI0027840BA2|nr:AAA family ATPase [Arthrobacter pascens]MDQ0632398.1 energy-coupling factor transporter ATP-binding protein EcfA2 [Arthrobacter pascens]
MRIERLQVETEGFLAGLDLKFHEGLNVIIGARGTGKTSVVELIRYCLGAGSFTEDAALRGNQQAVAVLDGGAVHLTIRDGNDSFVVSRSAAGHVSTTGGPKHVACTVLAQNEIEAVGAQGPGRLHLIDRFRHDRQDTFQRMESIRAKLSSLTAELAALQKERRALSEQLAGMSAITRELDEAKMHQQKMLEASKTSREQQDLLKSLQAAGQSLAATESTLSQDRIQTAAFETELRRLRASVPSLLQRWPESAGEDVLADYRPALRHIESLLDAAVGQVQLVAEGVTKASSQASSVKGSIDQESRKIRQVLESAQAGIGHTTRVVAELEERSGQLQALRGRLTERLEILQLVSAERDQLYEELDAIREQIYRERASIAAALNESLSPMVRVRVAKSENIENYSSAIIGALRGSGIHYNSIAPKLAREVSPQELVTWVETTNSAALGAALGIAPERALSIVVALQSQGAAEIITAAIDDGVGLDLLDGPEYKPTDRLSIGQRCTAVLPVLLGHHGDPLVLDQPEDHLDNAFIASTLVRALQRRQAGDQFILTSHNANIPVLGGADWVVVMESDGEKGFVSHQGCLDDHQIVSAVNRIMEGGTEAFATRATFYDRRGL